MMIRKALLLACLSLASASTQTPKIKSCSANSAKDTVVISDITASNVKVGATMTLKYLIQFKEKVSGKPQLVFTMTTGRTQLPCVNNIGSCTYNLCGASQVVEKQIASSWNNKCPISAGSYKNSLSIQIPSVTGLFAKDVTINVKIEVKNNARTLGCVQFDLKATR